MHDVSAHADRYKPMSEPKTNKPPALSKKNAAKREVRDARLAEALRANLKRRKGGATSPGDTRGGGKS
jgi:hypothetical protein